MGTVSKQRTGIVIEVEYYDKNSTIYSLTLKTVK